MRGARNVPPQRGDMQAPLVFFLFLTKENPEMNALKAIQTPFLVPNLRFTRPGRFTGSKRSTLCYGNSDEQGTNSPQPEGDKRKQEILARIAMLQAQKVRLTDFLDERSEYLTQFADDANVEFDKIGEDALKELDEAGARIMEKLENRVQAFEETAEISREEIQKNEEVLEAFEDQIEKEMNEGLFFKNLQLALISLLALTIANAVFGTAEVEWRKVAALGLILIGLLAQLFYEQSLSSVCNCSRQLRIDAYITSNPHHYRPTPST